MCDNDLIFTSALETQKNRRYGYYVHEFLPHSYYVHEHLPLTLSTAPLQQLTFATLIEDEAPAEFVAGVSEAAGFTVLTGAGLQESARLGDDDEVVTEVTLVTEEVTTVAGLLEPGAETEVRSRPPQPWVLTDIVAGRERPLPAPRREWRRRGGSGCRCLLFLLRLLLLILLLFSLLCIPFLPSFYRFVST